MLRHTRVSRIILFQSASFASLLLEFPIPAYAHGTVSSAERASTASYEFKRKLFEEPITEIWYYKVS